METGALRKRSKSNPEARSPQEQAKQVAREGSMVVSSTYEETKERESARADRQILESSEKQVLPRIFPDLDPLSPAAIEAGNQLGRALLEARQNAVLNSQSRFMEPGSSSDGKMEYMVVTTPEEKVEFAVVFAERVADVLDYHQQDAVENNIKNLLSSVETIGRFRILFLRGMESIQQFPIAMNSCDSHDFLRGVEFGKNYLRHIKSRTYRDRFGEDVATGTAPSTPGIRGWLYFANGKKIRKDQGYGNELVEEALRLGMENAVFPARSPTYQGSFLTPQRVENIKFREDQEQQFLTGGVILGFGERDDELAFPEQSLSEEMPVADKNPVPETTRAPWLQQAGRHFKAMTGRLTENDLSGPYATSGEMSTGSGYPVLAGQPSYPHSGYQPVSQNRQQELPAASPSYSCNFAFAEQLVKVRAVSGESYLPFDQTQRYGSAGSYGLTGSAPQYGSGGNCLQSDQMQPYTGSGGYAQDSQSSRYESGGGYPQDHNKRYGSLREYAQISHSRRHESVGQRELGYQTGTRGIHSSQGLQGQQDDRTCKQENYPFRSKGSKKQNRKNKKHADSTQVPAADAKGKGKGKWPQPSGSH